MVLEIPRGRSLHRSLLGEQAAEVTGKLRVPGLREEKQQFEGLEASAMQMRKERRTWRTAARKTGMDGVR